MPSIGAVKSNFPKCGATTIKKPYFLFLICFSGLLLLSMAPMEGTMGLFGLFGKSQQNNKLVKTSKMMDEQAFWKIIDESSTRSKSQDNQESYISKELQKLSPEGIIGFELRKDKLLYDSYRSDIWCAAYIINGGCSDDGFDYFRLWLISKGKEVYRKSLENPDYLITVADNGSEHEFESFDYIASTVFQKRTGKEITDYIDDSFPFLASKQPKMVFSWKEDDPESMKKICPKLFEKYNE
jgi:hypothetical protein